MGDICVYEPVTLCEPACDLVWVMCVTGAAVQERQPQVGGGRVTHQEERRDQFFGGTAGVKCTTLLFFFSIAFLFSTSLDKSQRVRFFFIFFYIS